MIGVIALKELEERILKDGKVLSNEVLKVGDFLNQQLDSAFMFRIGEEIARLYKDEKIDKILTIESSGIAVAMAAAYYLKCPVVFAKKKITSTIDSDVYSSRVHSFTHGNTYDAIVSKNYLHEGENILIADDFLARGNALAGLIDIVKQAKANIVGAAIVIEKCFQGGGDEFRAKGIRVESLALIDSMKDGEIIFRK